MLYPAELWVRHCYENIARMIAGINATTPITKHSCIVGPLNDAVPAFGTNQHTDNTRNVIINVKIMSINLQPQNNFKTGHGIYFILVNPRYRALAVTTSSRKKSYHDSSFHLSDACLLP